MGFEGGVMGFGGSLWGFGGGLGGQGGCLWGLGGHSKEVMRFWGARVWHWGGLVLGVIFGVSRFWGVPIFGVSWFPGTSVSECQDLGVPRFWGAMSSGLQGFGAAWFWGAVILGVL